MDPTEIQHTKNCPRHETLGRPAAQLEETQGPFSSSNDLSSYSCLTFVKTTGSLTHFQQDLEKPAPPSLPLRPDLFAGPAG